MRKIVVEVPDTCKECRFNELGGCMAFLDKKGYAIMVVKSNKPHKACRNAEAEVIITRN